MGKRKLTRTTPDDSNWIVSPPDAILSSDWHIRPSKPKCRLDDFFTAQRIKIQFIVDLAKKYECPILVAGDLSLKPEWQNWLLRWFIWITEGVNIIAIPGQHDLPDHRLDQVEKSGVGVLSEAGAIDLRLSPWTSDEGSFALTTFPYSIPLAHSEVYHSKDRKLSEDEPRVAMTHQMIIENEKLWEGQKAPEGHKILKEFPEYDLILSGDNHNAFTVEYEGRFLVNPGSLMRTTAIQIDHKPRVYLWYSRLKKIEPFYLPIQEGVVSREHIEDVEQEDERITAYIERMNIDYEIGFSYEGNLERHIERNDVEKEVESLIWEMIE